MIRAILSKINDDRRTVVNGEVIVNDDKRTVTNSEVIINDYTDYYEYGEFNLFDVVRVSWKDLEVNIYLDDEGMMKSGNLGRKVEGYPQPLFGNFIITGGVDDEGNTLPCPDAIQIKDLTDFIGSIDYEVR